MWPSSHFLLSKWPKTSVEFEIPGLDDPICQLVPSHSVRRF